MSETTFLQLDLIPDGTEDWGNRARSNYQKIDDGVKALDTNKADSDGDYDLLRARATTSGDVGLGNVDNVKQSPDGHNIAHHSDASGTTAARDSTSTTLLLQAKAMNDHVDSSTDHTKEDVGLGNVDNLSAADIRSGTTKTDIDWKTRDFIKGIALGEYSENDYEDGFVLAIGYDCFTRGANGGVALGRLCEAGNQSTAIGFDAEAVETDSVAIHGTATAENQMVLGSSDWTVHVPGEFTAGTKTFEIDHPHPDKTETHRLRHACYEGPVPGGTIYRYEVDAKKGEASLVLPDYFQHLNKDVDVHVSPDRHFGRAYGYVEGNTLTVKADADGKYKVLIFGTRKDEDVQGWDLKGVERLKGETWDGKTCSIIDSVQLEDGTEIKKTYRAQEGQVTTKKEENIRKVTMREGGDIQMLRREDVPSLGKMSNAELKAAKTELARRKEVE